MIRKISLCLMIIFLGSASAFAVISDPDKLENPAQEKRAQEIMEKLRCLVCQNQSIVESDADHARDLRNIVRERVVAGDKEEDVIKFMTSRYGDWVLLLPPFTMMTLLLWFSPVLLLGIGIFILIQKHRKMKMNSHPKTDDLTEEESQRLSEILKNAGEDE